MAWNENLAYNNKIISNSKIYNICASELDKISERDYPTKHYLKTGILCLDMDEYEKKINKVQQDRTVDAVIGINNYDRHQLKNSRKLLIELRMGYTGPQNLDRAELTEKVNHTRSILNQDGTIESHYVFVFTNSAYTRVRRWFRDFSEEYHYFSSYEPWSVSMVNDMILSPDNYPYIPYTDIDKMTKDLNLKMRADDRLPFLERIDFWLKTASKLRYRKPQEFKAIITPIMEIWNNYKKSITNRSDEEQLQAEILGEDFPEFINM